jgi:hypothetical protein
MVRTGRNHEIEDAFAFMDNIQTPTVVMVVDDDVVGRMGATDTLQYAGYTAIEAGGAPVQRPLHLTGLLLWRVARGFEQK